MAHDRNQQSLAGRIGAHVSWSRTVDRAARTASARKAAAARFEKMVPAEITDPVARAEAAEHLRKAHYIKMALASAKVRRNRAKSRITSAGNDGLSGEAA